MQNYPRFAMPTGRFDPYFAGIWPGNLMLKPPEPAKTDGRTHSQTPSYTTFDSGPGQMMLRTRAFFDAYDPTMVQTRTISEKVADLFALYEDGEQRLRVNRDRDLAMYRDAVAKFLDSDNWVVTPTTQESLSLR